MSELRERADKPRMSLDQEKTLGENVQNALILYKMRLWQKTSIKQDCMSQVLRKKEHKFKVGLYLLTLVNSLLGLYS